MKIKLGLCLCIALITVNLTVIAYGDQSIYELKGDYYLGNGFADNQKLHLSQDGTFSFLSAGSFLNAKVEGSYSVENGVVVLSPKTLSSHENNQDTDVKVDRVDDYSRYPTRFLPVRWGERLYLVNESEIISFINSINLGSEPRKEVYGTYYLRWGDEKKPTTARYPELPEQWMSYLLKESINGCIVDVKGGKVAVINFGSNQGLKVGMVVGARKNRRSQWVALKIVQVSKETAKAELENNTNKIEIGYEVTTRLH